MEVVSMESLESCWRPEHAHFMKKTRISQKKRKNWQGRKKPMEMKVKDEDQKMEEDVQFMLNKLNANNKQPKPNDWLIDAMEIVENEENDPDNNNSKEQPENPQQPPQPQQWIAKPLLVYFCNLCKEEVDIDHECNINCELCGQHERYQDYKKCLKCGKRLCNMCSIVGVRRIIKWEEQEEDIFNKNKWTASSIVPFDPFEFVQYICPECDFQYDPNNNTNTNNNQECEIKPSPTFHKPKKISQTTRMDQLIKQWNKEQQMVVAVMGPTETNEEELETDYCYEFEQFADDEELMDDAIHSKNWKKFKWDD